MMKETISAVLMLFGSLLMLLGALGVLRLPDLYMRVSASTKASTLGGFIIITAPVAAHLISRAAYLVDAPLWKGTIVDELQDRIDPKRR